MDNFKDLEKKTIERHPMPLGIQSEVKNRLGNMRTFGNVIELYLSRILDALVALFGGETNKQANTHMVTLFLQTKPSDLNEVAFLRNLVDTLDLSVMPIILWILPTEDGGVEVSVKLPSEDAAKLRQYQNKKKLSTLRMEIR